MIISFVMRVFPPLWHAILFIYVSLSSLNIFITLIFHIKHIHNVNLCLTLHKAQFTTCLLEWQSHFHPIWAGAKVWQWLVGSICHPGTDATVKGQSRRLLLLHQSVYQILLGKASWTTEKLFIRKTSCREQRKCLQLFEV